MTTAIAVPLAGLWARQVRPALIVALDPRRSLTTYVGYDPDDIDQGVYSLFQGGPDSRSSAASILLPTDFENLFLMPASTALATLDRQLGAREGMGLVIGRALGQLRERFAHVFIDCPPVLGVLMINAMAASEHLLIPVQTEFLALKGLERMMRTLSMVTQARRIPLHYTIVPTMFDRRTRASLQTLKVLRERYPGELWKSVIPVDTQFREASRQGLPLSVLNAHARGTIAYTALLNDLLGPDERIVQQAAAQ